MQIVEDICAELDTGQKDGVYHFLESGSALVKLSFLRVLTKDQVK